MSLQVDDSSRRARSRSPGRRRDSSRGPPAEIVDAVPYPDSSDYGRGGSSSAAYEYERLASYRAPSPAMRGGRDEEDNDGEYSYRGSREKVVDVKYTSGDPRNEKERASKRSDSGSDRERERERARHRNSLQHLPAKYARNVGGDAESPRYSRDSLRDREKDWERERERERDRRLRHDSDDDDGLAYGSGPIPPREKYSRPESPGATYAYAQAEPWKYARPDEKVTYTREETRYSSSSLDPRQSSSSMRVPSPGPGRSDSKHHRRGSSYSGDPKRSSLNVVTIEPGAQPRKSAMKHRDSSPLPPQQRLSTLSLQTPHHSAYLSLASGAPASPLLESYQGTYQSLSPMPSPLLLPTSAGLGGGLAGAEIFEALSPVGSDVEGSDKKRNRRARFHDPVDDAARLAKALKGDRRAPETGPLIEILPGLTHEQVLELRAEYKRLVKTGAERKGVNVAKHIRARLKDEDPSLMKACYATALGRWESEAYWANFWYQGDKTRRELLIEALMGRTNDEIREIKAGFSDKKYGESLTRCMKTELKEDKFKKAVLLVLDEQRMEETDAYGRPQKIDPDLVVDDVRELYHCVRSEKGGETAMIKIVLLRSDAHLREVLRLFSQKYQSNFARDALKKSGNLVGEILAHVLNGVINKPVRDAMLLQHALTASRRDELRRELLISRLVRYHWDRHHMAAIKLAYRERYGQDLTEAVRHGTSGDWGEFCQALCISRMPDEVKRVERVEIIRK